MKILVTGGAGFIGSNIADAYIEKGHDVVIIDNLYMGNKKNVNPKAKFIEMDICDKSIADIFKNEKFDAINHHAAQIDVRKSVSDPVFDASVNILGSVNLLQNAVESGVKKFIFSSSGGTVYGDQQVFPADESHPEYPISQYGVAKLAFEKYLFTYKYLYGIEYVALRYANVYGPRQNPHGEAGVIAIFCNKLLKSEKCVINGDGKQTRDYVFVKDVVQANLLALEYKGSGSFNVGSGIETDVNTIFRIIAGKIGNFEEIHGPAKKGEAMRSVLTANKIEKTMGWKLSTGIEEGLEITLKWAKENID
jgi:UDP-glucose 4-epimerase